VDVIMVLSNVVLLLLCAAAGTGVFGLLVKIWTSQGSKPGHHHCLDGLTDQVSAGTCTALHVDYPLRWYT